MIRFRMVRKSVQGQTKKYHQHRAIRVDTVDTVGTVDIEEFVSWRYFYYTLLQLRYNLLQPHYTLLRPPDIQLHPVTSR